MIENFADMNKDLDSVQSVTEDADNMWKNNIRLCGHEWFGWLFKGTFYWYYRIIEC